MDRFEVTTDIEGNGEAVRLSIEHPDESFTVSSEGEMLASILNNGDNTWQLVEGNLSQEAVNVIGSEIEKYYNNLNPLA
ncbi:hypothetical protein [Desertivirga brevis]|uniref:hypothetical protein n=1 Tax=Desertivirga brevis TaxID=2810310 RepID=UPI001A9721A9|nr:hypothetical protein [Pedobacter sp. SYSU D00873]